MLALTHRVPAVATGPIPARCLRHGRRSLRRAAVQAKQDRDVAAAGRCAVVGAPSWKNLG